MVKAPQGLRHRTRKLMRKSVRERGRVPPLSKILINYKIGDSVYIKVDPSIHKGMPHRMYIGKVGKIVGFRGKALEVEVKVGSKIKKLFLLPEHVEPAFPIQERIKEVLDKLNSIAKIRQTQRKIFLSLVKTSK
ncbi:LSU ribosomal protein L21E [Ignisphaera aggregans DSM 17230]|uniref:Large ribosomal subunit protein eL21 n=1 Tax=Ignisphaera aggregans (strain DSM 17230 / JCM 13409 / AQ1.S1) TaxID=583356 RepID=E0SNQ9_IGNAA|nr:LSU ribosomal protein L21E [Ignisphaera aggregans DSM 17230]